MNRTSKSKLTAGDRLISKRIHRGGNDDQNFNDKPDEEILDSAESIALEMLELPDNKYSEPDVSVVGKTFYYVTYDSDFDKRYNVGNTRIHAHGNIRELLKSNNKIPLLDNVIEAKKIAQKLVARAIEHGTTSGKGFPIGGAVILGFKIGQNVTIDNRNSITQNGGADYNGLFSFLRDRQTKDMTVYEILTPTSDGSIKKSKRAVISPEGIKKCELVTASYGFTVSTPKNIVFAILNSRDDMSENDIRLLNDMFNGNVVRFNNQPPAQIKEELNTPVNVIPSSNLIFEKIDEQPQTTQTTQTTNDARDEDILFTDIMESLRKMGEDDKTTEPEKNNGKLEYQEGGDFKKYKAEKQRYLHLKKLCRQKGLNV